MDLSLFLFLPALLMVSLRLAARSLRGLVKPPFRRRPFLGPREAAMFEMLDTAAREAFGRRARVCPQVSYAAFLGCANGGKRARLAGKRADFVVLFHHAEVALVVVYRHVWEHGVTRRARRRAAREQKARAAALREADIPVLELSGRPSIDDLTEEMQDAVFGRAAEAPKAAVAARAPAEARPAAAPAPVHLPPADRVPGRASASVASLAATAPRRRSGHAAGAGLGG